MKLKSVYNDYSNTYNSYTEYDINGNVIEDNNPGYKSNYFYDNENRLIKKVKTEDYGAESAVFEYNYEYHNFGYRISEFLTKRVDNNDDTTQASYEPRSTVDVKTKDGKEISRITTDFRTKTVVETKPNEPEPEPESIETHKYDKDNRVIETINKDSETGFMYITDYHYSISYIPVVGVGSSGETKQKKIIKLIFYSYIKPDGSYEKAQLEAIIINTYDGEGSLINEISQNLYTGEREYGNYNSLIKIYKTSYANYFLDDKAISIDKTFDNIEKNITIHRYTYSHPLGYFILSTTSISINCDNLIIDNVYYEYFKNDK